jgi:hypothetical protein
MLKMDQTLEKTKGTPHLIVNSDFSSYTITKTWLSYFLKRKKGAVFVHPLFLLTIELKIGFKALRQDLRFLIGWQDL